MVQVFSGLVSAIKIDKRGHLCYDPVAMPDMYHCRQAERQDLWTSG